MNRRKFLEILSQASIISIFDIEKLLWIPGAKKIFIPKYTTIMPMNVQGLPYNMYPWPTGPIFWMGIKRD